MTKAELDPITEVIGEPYILITFPPGPHGKPIIHVKAHGMSYQDVKDGIFEAARRSQSNGPIGWEGPQ